MVRFCTSCGAELSDDLRFCTECGAPLEEKASVGPPAQDFDLPVAPARQPQPAPRQRTAYEYEQEDPRPVRRGKAPGPNSPYAPITTWGFVGTMLLLSIPLVGLVLAIAWACGGCRKINKRNLSRAFLILMAIGLIFGLIAGFIVRGIVKCALEEAGLSEDLLSGDAMEGLGALAAIGMLGGDSDSGGSGNSDLDQLGQLADMMEGLEGLTGEESGGDAINELIDDVEDINARAEAVNDGWPATLRPYSGGTAEAVASYRTEISDTTLEDMKGWIDDLKGDGFKFQDFYDFGFSEQDMLDSMNAWWATDGSIYLSVSYYDGVVTIDHTKELPDLESYFN